MDDFLPEPGATPGHGFVLVRRIGSGGFGEVWEANAPGGFRVALKFVRLGDQVGTIESGSLELLKDLRHPNVVATFSAWVERNNLVVAMELAECTLWDRL